MAGVAHILAGNGDTVAVSVRRRSLIILYEDENSDDPGEDSSTSKHIGLLKHVPASSDANTSLKNI